MIDVAAFVNTASETGRGDCVALCDLDDSIYYTGMSQSDAIKVVEKAASQLVSKYAGIVTPSISYDLADANYSNRQFPASFHYLACAAKARENNFAE